MKVKHWVWAAVSLAVVAGAVGWVAWKIITSPTIAAEEIVAKKGLHWHPELAIVIKGQKQEIPANIGLGAVHQSMHTHDTSGTLHLEMRGLVRRQDITLGRFFEIWGKQLTSSCIFDFCNGADGSVKMSVNGNDNSEFADYHLQDGDKVEIRYE